MTITAAVVVAVAAARSSSTKNFYQWYNPMKYIFDGDPDLVLLHCLAMQFGHRHIAS
jgi:hypothetical protein